MWEGAWSSWGSHSPSTSTWKLSKPHTVGVFMEALSCRQDVEPGGRNTMVSPLITTSADEGIWVRY